MLRTLAIALVVIVAGVLAWASTRPDTFRVERSTTINAPAEAIFPLLNNFRKWASWSPWDKLDPDMQRTYSGEKSGTGAAYEWSGNRAVGSGRMEIIQSVPWSKIAISLHFVTPFEASNTAEFYLHDEGGTTTVTWAMFGPSPFISKVIGLFVSMDDMVGGDFASGLANLKRAVEAGR